MLAAMRAQPRDPQIAAGIARFGLYMFGVGYGECHVAGCGCEPIGTPWCYTVGRVESGEAKAEVKRVAMHAPADPVEAGVHR